MAEFISAKIRYTLGFEKSRDRETNVVRTGCSPATVDKELCCELQIKACTDAQEFSDCLRFQWGEGLDRHTYISFYTFNPAYVLKHCAF